MKFTYTKEFAESVWKIFGGFKAELIVDKDSSVNQLLSRDDQWYSEQGSKFQKIDMMAQWKAINFDKIRIEKLYRKVPLNNSIQTN
tara:strand:- start:345 stop:602 length:258 start_codon:yes stop_codon:yes gene_type:complete